MRTSVPLWVELWRMLNIILGGLTIGLFIRYALCVTRRKTRLSTVSVSISVGLALLALAIVSGTVASLRLGVGLTISVPLCTLGEMVGIKGMLDLLILDLSKKKSKDE